MNQPAEPSDREIRLQAALVEILESSKSGQAIDRQALLARYPDLAAELDEFLANRSALDRMTTGLRPPAPGKGSACDQPTVGGTEATGGTGKRIRYFGDYEILEEVARGGMGVVYKARQTTLKRVVALKMILTGHLASEEDVKRFYAEAEAAARLKHPNIVPIFEIGQAEGQHYFSMAFVQGESLAQRLARGVLPPREAARILHLVAQAIAFAHIEGVVHRDLKPANILLDELGAPHVTDFGLAKRVAGGGDPASMQQLTAAGQVLGTPSYMPPEQASGRAAQIGPLADVYSLGAVLYCALSGRPPFQAATPLDTLLQVLEQDPVPLRQLNAAIPKDLETIAMKCLEKDPRQRYASARELAEELGRFLHDEPIRARPLGLVERGWRFVRKQRRGVALTAAAVVVTLLAGGAGLAGWFWYQDWQLGYVMLKTDKPPLVAEILDGAGNRIAGTFTVPTQEPVAVPAGEYDLRLSSEGRLSQSYRITVDRASNAPMSRLNLNLEDQLYVAQRDASTSLAVPLGYELLAPGGRADVWLYVPQGISRPVWPGQGPAWSLQLAGAPQAPRFPAAPGLRWPWITGTSHADLAYEAFHPQVLRETPDLNGDGAPDVVLAARHQAWVLAVSGGDGSALWLAARGSDVLAPDPQAQPAWQTRCQSAVLGAPLVLPDQDGDAVVDLVAVMADGGHDPAGPRRWIECLSGRTGQPLWRLDLESDLFRLPAGVEAPAASAWFTEISGYGGMGGSMSSYGDDIVRTVDAWQIHGNSHVVPFRPQLAALHGKSLLVAVAGVHALKIDLVTGTQVGEKLELGLPPVRPPQLADLDGDGNPELVLVQSAAPTGGQAAGNQQNNDAFQLTGWSLTEQRRLWQYPLHVRRSRPVSYAVPYAPWPVVDDLDGDGRAELIVPNRAPGAKDRQLLWGQIEVLEGTPAGGVQRRWQRSIKCMDQPIDHFIVGPDLDGDSRRDLFVATLRGRQYDLFVDALSGHDGTSIWWSSQSLGWQSQFLAGLHWWPAGNGGTNGRVVVAARPEYRGELLPQLLLFEPATGEFLGTCGQVDAVQFADADGDGASEMFAFLRNNPGNPAERGRLWAFRGGSTEDWRRAGGNWIVAQDYNADGVTDLVWMTEDYSSVLRAISGSDGKALWRRQFDNRQIDAVRPLEVDLDADGTPDLLAFKRPRGSTAGGLNRNFPLAAVSGASGALLWNMDMPYGAINGVLLAEARDLDGDGAIEVIFSTFADWDYPRNTVGTNRVQHWLAVVEGRTGAMKWRKPLSAAYGLPGASTFIAYQTEGVQLQPSFADLNADGVQDLVLPAESAGTAESPARLELRALDGRDGTLLWRRDLPADLPHFNQGPLLQNAPAPAAADLDGDGKPEILVLEYKLVRPEPPAEAAQPAAPPQPVRYAQLVALEGSTGRELWSNAFDVDDECGNVGQQESRLRCKPMPLVLKSREGPPRICLGLWGWFRPGRVIVIDHQGNTVTELASKSFEQFYFRPWIHDVDGDGSDEVVVLHAGTLQCLNPWDNLRPRWEWLVPAGYNRDVAGFLPAGSGEAGQLVVRSGATLYGISGRDASLRWTNAGPRPRNAAGLEPWVAGIGLLASPANNEPARAAFQVGDQFVACRRAVAATSAGAMPGRAPQAAGGQPARRAADSMKRQRQTSEDPRIVMYPSWMPQEGERLRTARMIGWGSVLALLVLVLPAWVTLRQIEHGRLGAGMLLKLLLPVLLALAVLQFPGPGEFDRGVRWTAWERCANAVSCLPVPGLVLGLTLLVARRRWRWLLATLASALVLGLLFTTIAVVKDMSTLVDGERYVLAAWDIPLGYTLFALGWVMTPGVAIWALVRAVRARIPAAR